MADSGPSRRRGWIPRVRVIPGNGLDRSGTFWGPVLAPILLAPIRSGTLFFIIRENGCIYRGPREH